MAFLYVLMIAIGVSLITLFLCFPYLFFTTCGIISKPELSFSEHSKKAKDLLKTNIIVIYFIEFCTFIIPGLILSYGFDTSRMVIATLIFLYFLSSKVVIYKLSEKPLF